MRIRYDRPLDEDTAHRIEQQSCRFGDVYLLKPHTFSYKRRVPLVNGQLALNPHVLAIRVPDPDDDPIDVTFNDQLERWEPTNPELLKPFEWFEINRSELRAANQRYNISEFITAIETAMQMTDVPNAGSSKHERYSRVNGTIEDGKSILDLLDEGRYIDAAGLLRVNENRTWDAEAKRYNTEVVGVKKRDIKKIRNLAYRQLGVTYLEQQPVISLPQLVNAEQKLVDFGKPITDRVL